MHPIASQAPASLSLSNVPSLDTTAPLPYPSNEQTPTRFLASCSKMEFDMEPNPFEYSFGAGTSSSSSSAGGPIGSDIGLTPTSISALINYGGSVVKTPGSLDGPKSTLPPLSAMAASSSAINLSEFRWGQGSLRLGPLSPAMLVEPQNQPLPTAVNGSKNGSASPGPMFYGGSIDPKGAVPPTLFNNLLVPPIQVQDFDQQNLQKTAQLNGFFYGSDAQKSQSIDFNPAATGEEHISFYSRDAELPVPTNVSAGEFGTGGRLPFQHSYSSANPATWSLGENPLPHHPSSAAKSYVATNPMVTVATESNTRASTTRKRKGPSRRAASGSRSPESVRRRSSVTTVTRSSGSTTKKNRRKSSNASRPGDDADIYTNERMADSTYNNHSRKKDGTGKTRKNTHASRSTSAAAEDDENDGNHSSGSEEGGQEEDKRKSFLERNRQAALKCRQRKKQWLQRLQQTVESLSSDNRDLQGQATSLREEIINLKTLLIAHKDCPVAQANGVMGLDTLNAAGSTDAIGVDAGRNNLALSTALNGVSRVSASMVPRSMPATQYENGAGFFDSAAPTTNISRKQLLSGMQCNPQPPEVESESSKSNYRYPRGQSFSRINGGNGLVGAESMRISCTIAEEEGRNSEVACRSGQ